VSRGHGRWQREIVLALADTTGFAVIDHFVRQLKRTLKESEYSAILRAATHLEAAGYVRGVWVPMIDCRGVRKREKWLVRAGRWPDIAPNRRDSKC